MLLDKLKAIVGAGHWTTDPAELQPHLRERRGAITGRAQIMVLPDTTEQVAAIVGECAAAGISIVPQGGNTGLCGGAIPDDSGKQVLLSLTRLNRIREVAADDFSMTVEAGCVLQRAQEAADKVDRLLPLSLAAEGSCQIGGNIATNAGGINVIRYGTMRQQVLGLEVVLANGAVWDGLRSLRKDTAGYDLKQVFIGSEGTLGIITAATLRLYPAIGETTTALVAVPTATEAVKLLGLLRAHQADQLLAFELMSDRAYSYGAADAGFSASPFTTDHPWYVLLEAAESGHTDTLQDFLVDQVADGTVLDAVVAKSIAEARQLWQVRHGISEGQKSEGASLKHDVSVPIGRINEFMLAAEQAVLEVIPDARIVAFGHVGDGNLHYNITQPAGADTESFLRLGAVASKAVYELVAELGGSFSAEHGVGVLKKSFLEMYRGGIEVDMMRTLKKALDPHNTLNPGKVI